MENETKEEVNEEQTEEVLYTDDTVLEVKPLGMRYDKNELLDRTITLEVLGLGKNRWDKEFLYCVIDNKEAKLQISGKNHNELVDILGTKMSDWKNKHVKVTGKLWEGIIDEEKRVGVQLTFSP